MQINKQSTDYFDVNLLNKIRHENNTFFINS